MDKIYIEYNNILAASGININYGNGSKISVEKAISCLEDKFNIIGIDVFKFDPERPDAFIYDELKKIPELTSLISAYERHPGIKEEYKIKLAKAYSKRGDAYKYNKMYDEAIADYTNSIFLTNEGYYYGYRAKVYSLLGEHDKAIADMLVYIEKSYCKELACFDLIKIYIRASRFTEAIELTTKILNESSINEIGWRRLSYENRAKAYLGLKDYAKAVADYTEFLKISTLHPHESSTIYLYRAQVYELWWKEAQKQNNIEEVELYYCLAWADYLTVVELDSEVRHIKEWIEAVKVHNNIGKLSLKIELFKQTNQAMVARNNSLIEADNYVHKATAAKKNATKVTYMREAIEIYKNFPPTTWEEVNKHINAYHVTGMLCYERGHCSEAFEYLISAQILLDEIQIYFDDSKINIRFEKAVIDYTNLLESNGNDAELYKMRASAYNFLAIDKSEQGLTDEAMSFYKLAWMDFQMASLKGDREVHKKRIREYERPFPEDIVKKWKREWLSSEK